MTSPKFLFIEKPVSGYTWSDMNALMDKMYGAGNWCQDGCAMPLGPRTGRLTIDSSTIRKPRDIWSCHWSMHELLLSEKVADVVRTEFEIQLMPVDWTGKDRGECFELMPTRSSATWFDEDELRESVTRIHGTDKEACSKCGNDRWLPIRGSDQAPPVQRSSLPDNHYIESVEQFGTGFANYRMTMMSRELYECIRSVTKLVKQVETSLR